MESLFDLGVEPEREALLGRIGAMIAPVAANAGAVVDDPALIPVARAVYEAFGSADAADGLTRGQIGDACQGVCTAEEFDSRFHLFVSLGMLQPVFDKSHQQRYVFNPTSAAGLMVFDRLAERGGVDELVMLLNRTRSDLLAGTATREQVKANLRECKQTLAIMTAHLARLVASSTLETLKAESKHYATKNLHEEVMILQKVVTDTFPDLDPDAKRLLDEAQRYYTAQLGFIGRMLDEGAATRDFSLLDPEQYLSAALTSPTRALAEVFARVVFDPPVPWLDPTVVATGVAGFRPRAATRRRPPRSADPEADEDPLARIEERAAAARARRNRTAEVLLQGQDAVELSSRMRTSWQTAASTLVEVLAAHADPDLPFQITMSDELLVDEEGAVTYLTPITLHRDTTDSKLSALVDTLAVEQSDV